MAKVAEKSKKKYRAPQVGETQGKCISWVLAIYLFFMMGIYPLYYENKYFNMGDAKWHFFKNVSCVFFIIITGFFIWYLMAFINKNKFKELCVSAYSKFVITDYLVLIYMVLCCLSTILAPDKSVVIWGYEGWYMGLVAQLGFVMIYFFISRFWKWDELAVFFYMAVSILVFFFGVIMRFRVDPMEMYTGLEDMYVRNFLSTMGQATWYSSYMTLLYPLSIVAYWKSEKLWQRITFGIFTSIGFMTAVTQNSDSAYLAFVGIMFVLFWISMEENKYFLRFCEIVVMALASFVFMGILQLGLPERRVYLDKLSTFMSQDNLIKYLLGLSIILYVVFFLMNKKGKLNIEKVKHIRIIFLVLLIAGIAAGIIYIYLNTTGQLPEKYASDNNYLLFDDSWGNNRGLSWKAAVGTFMQCDWARKLFGAGPDSFASLVYQYYGEELRTQWGQNTTLTCCHNEWMNAVINMGLLGGIVYLGIFVAAFRRFMKEGRKHLELYAIAMAIIAYIFHNMFCYQQIICTPTIFIMIGAGEAIIRRGTSEE